MLWQCVNDGCGWRTGIRGGALCWRMCIVWVCMIVYNEHRVIMAFFGGMAEWSIAADCKSAELSLRWFESSSLHHLNLQAPFNCDAAYVILSLISLIFVSLF